MLTDIDILAWYMKLGIVERARAVIDHIRSSRSCASRWWRPS